MEAVKGNMLEVDLAPSLPIPIAHLLSHTTGSQITNIHPPQTIKPGNIFYSSTMLTSPTAHPLNLFHEETTWKSHWRPLHKDEFAELTTLLHVRYLIFCPSQVLEEREKMDVWVNWLWGWVIKQTVTHIIHLWSAGWRQLTFRPLTPNLLILWIVRKWMASQEWHRTLMMWQATNSSSHVIEDKTMFCGMFTKLLHTNSHTLLPFAGVIWFWLNWSWLNLWFPFTTGKRYYYLSHLLQNCNLAFFSKESGNST